MYTIGIDEAGRGALAGPVVVAAVAIPKNWKSNIVNLPKLRDSKGLSHRQREVWYQYIVEHPEIFFSSARMYQKGIDKINISQSSNIVASRALNSLLSQLKQKTIPEVLLDGSLYLGGKNHEKVPSKTIIRGDQKRVAIKLASIVAKVTRDRYLDSLDRRYPKYGFRQHKGYGTKKHFAAIKRHGILEIHRLTYLTKQTKN